MGYLDIRPIFIPKRSTIERLQFSPGGIQAVGSTDGGPCTIVTLDHRGQGCRPSSKETLERIQLERFRSDFLCATADLPFDDVVRGGDPPDFVVRSQGGTFGVDMAALALTERRLAYRLFDHLVSEMEVAPDRFPNLLGTHALIWFNTGKGLPPKRSDRVLRERIVESLRSRHIDRARLGEITRQMAGSPMPIQFPQDYPIHSLDDQSAGFAIGLLPEEHHPSPFASRTGFECSLHMGIFVDHIFLKEEVARLVRKHDKPGTHWLLLSAGAPDTAGWCHSGEEVLFAQTLQITASARHLRRIALHQWSTGRILSIQIEEETDRSRSGSDAEARPHDR